MPAEEDPWYAPLVKNFMSESGKWGGRAIWFILLAYSPLATGTLDILKAFAEGGQTYSFWAFVAVLATPTMGFVLFRAMGSRYFETLNDVIRKLDAANALQHDASSPELESDTILALPDRRAGKETE